MRVNGRPFAAESRPGSFAALTREWSDGDTVEYTVGTPLSLQAVEAQSPSTGALLRGPLALFAMGTLDATFRRNELLSARQQTAGAAE